MIFLTSILVWSNCNTSKQKSWNLAPKGMQECPSKPLVFQDQKRVKSPHPLTFSALTLATSFAPWVVSRNWWFPRGAISIGLLTDLCRNMVRFIGLPGIFDLNMLAVLLRKIKSQSYVVLSLVLLFLCHCRFLEDLNCFLQISTKRIKKAPVCTSTTPLHRRIYWFEPRHKPTKQQNPTNRNDVWLYDRLCSGLLEWNAVITVYGK